MSGHIAVLGTGGTIATDAESGDGRRPRRSAAQLVASLLSANPGRVTARDVVRKNSSALGPPEVWELAQAVEDEIAAGATGVVITHGTDTIEETAYGLALLLTRRVPIAITGAMRGPDLPGSDAAANLAAALVATRTSALAEFGPVVVLQDEVHLARWVTKVHTSRVAAFASPTAGPIGYVSEGRVHLVAEPAGHGDEQLPGGLGPQPTARVALIWAVSGDDGLHVERLADVADGIVVAAAGGGHVSPALADALLEYVASGRPAVLASRTQSGPMLRETYAGPGSETRLLGGGLVSAGLLAPLKARLRLLYGLSRGLNPRTLFEAHEEAR
jgi:L-asparaginase